MEFIKQFVMEGFIIIPVLVGIISQIVKVKLFKDADLVPIFALGLAIVLAVLHGAIALDMGFSGFAILTCVEQGVLAGAIAVAGFDVVKGVVRKVQEQNRIT